METGHDQVLPRYFGTGTQLEDLTQWIYLIGIDSRLLECVLLGWIELFVHFV